MVAKTLMEQFYTLLNQFGITADLKWSKRGHYRLKIYGSDNIDKVQWKNIKYDQNKRTNSRLHVDQEYIYSPITKIESYEYQDIVYNIETTDDHSYVLQSIVHNCLPGAHAMALGIPLITTRFGGSLQYAKPELCTYIEPKSHKTYPSMDGIPQFANCIWPVISVSDLRDVMRKSFENYPKEKAEKAYNYVHNNFSYEIVGKKLLDVVSL